MTSEAQSAEPGNRQSGRIAIYGSRIHSYMNVALSTKMSWQATIDLLTKCGSQSIKIEATLSQGPTLEWRGVNDTITNVILQCNAAVAQIFMQGTSSQCVVTVGPLYKYPVHAYKRPAWSSPTAIYLSLSFSPPLLRVAFPYFPIFQEVYCFNHSPTLFDASWKGWWPDNWANWLDRS